MCDDARSEFVFDPASRAPAPLWSTSSTTDVETSRRASRHRAELLAETRLLGSVLGTLEYLAPELARDGEAAAETSDQYALGVVLYDCATGRKPFGGSTDYEVMHAAIHVELVPPSLHALPENLYADRGVLSPRSAPRGQTDRDDDVDGPRRRSSSATRLRASYMPPTRTSSSAPPGPRGVRPSVLVVDDDELNLQTFRRAFRGDFEITCADSGACALAILAGASFDVALIDYAMPGMNGAELLRAARALWSDLAAVMVTAHADLAEVREAHANGWVHAVIMKPYDREGILRWVLHCHRMASMRKTVGLMMSHVKEGGRS